MALFAALCSLSLPSTLFINNLVGTTGQFERRALASVRGRRGGKISRAALLVRAANGGGNLGEWGARDPSAAELASNFGDKVVGFGSTEHNILIPTLATFSLAEKSCTPLPEGTAPLSEDEAKALLRKVVGWRLFRTDAGLKLQCDWNLKDSDAVTELSNRVGVVGDAENHHPELQTLESNKVRAEIWTQSIGGLSENDFILAAKIDKLDTRDLIRRNRIWF